MVPIVNASRLFASCSTHLDGTSNRAEVDAAVSESLREHGCVVLHGLPPAARLVRSRASALCSYLLQFCLRFDSPQLSQGDTLYETLSVLIGEFGNRFFSLPTEVKAAQQVAVQRPGNSNVFWGYYARHQGPVESAWLYNEHIQIGPTRDVPCHGTWSEDEGRFVVSFTHGGNDPHFAASPWPEESVLPGWRQEMESYFLAMEEVGEAILRAVVRFFGAAALGVVDDDDAAAHWCDGVSSLRPMRYPALPPDLRPALPAAGFSLSESGRLITAGEHCDNGTGISLLWQESPGLQVRSPTTEEWLDVP
eukprot:COSAG02_NODE_701_length_18335_cov_18.672955_21_plen_307_part_00